MINRNDLKRKAVSLRLHGLSYNEINHEINISKSTLSYWLKNVEMKPKYLKRFYTKQIKILARGPKSQQERRAKIVDELIKDSQKEITLPLENNIYKFIGLGLYWAEGSKGKILQITNSDPYLILFFIKWLEKIFSIKPAVLKTYLNIYPQQDEKKLKKFWSELTKIPLKNFGKSYIKPESKGYKKNNLYYGTIRIYVPKSTDIKYRMLGWLQALLQDLKPDVELVQERWLLLRNTNRAVNLKK